MIYILLITLVSSCAGTKVIEFVNNDLDFEEYKTYRIVNVQTDNKTYSEEGHALFANIEDEIRLNMELRGFVEHTNAPDLIVGYKMSSVTTVDSPRQSVYKDTYYYTEPPKTNYHHEGLMLIEFRDRHKEKLVWQASLDWKHSPKNTPDTILKTSIDKIFETYPYKAGMKDGMVRL
ncbi:DUF4136 domain-containing protein [Reichenbachiella agarivorans]|uniref:DUF4136 domain-containing protein n=1 Tax=Reichenbachiella agarivorans TaxID=2979464 RepID=A0ABY6CQ97_9BACT|nr:DUF4136 domain-containing protein [Reichenbachiella agarivorans]UXP31613.1 DUF4136 domain-containing protein [Reichenbachiella agarivorans]